MPTQLSRLPADPHDAVHLASVLAAVGATDSPAVLTLQVRDLGAAGEQLLAAGHCYSLTADGTCIRVSIGDALTVVITASAVTA